ncbi:MAG: hypothetical protein ABI697_13390 [Devosia sp.]
MGPAVVTIGGYALNAIGVVLMVRYGLPYSLPILGLLRKALTEKEATEEDKRHLLGALGFVLLALGTLLQIVSVVLR